LKDVLASVAGLICVGFMTDAVAQPRMLDHLEWKSFPSGDQIAHVFPDEAIRAKKSGWALLECSLTAKGGLELCQVIGEQPSDYGFGEAALRVAPRFKFASKSKEDGGMEGSYIRVPVVLQANGVAPPPFSYRAGDPSILLTTAKTGAQPIFPCATATEPKNNAKRTIFTGPKDPNWRTRPRWFVQQAMVPVCHCSSATLARTTV
jgi:TonB family protein